MATIGEQEATPLCQVADIFLLGDLFDIVPELTETLRARQQVGPAPKEEGTGPTAGDR